MIGKHYTKGGGMKIKLHSQSVGGRYLFQDKYINHIVKMDLQLSVSAHPQALHLTAISQHSFKNSPCNSRLLTIIVQSLTTAHKRNIQIELFL